MFSWFKKREVAPVKKIKQIREYYTAYYSGDLNLPYQAYRVNFVCYSLDKIYRNSDVTELYQVWEDLVPEEVADIIRANIVDKGDFYIFNRPKSIRLKSEGAVEKGAVEICSYCNNNKPSNSKCPSCGA